LTEYDDVITSLLRGAPLLGFNTTAVFLNDVTVSENDVLEAG